MSAMYRFEVPTIITVLLIFIVPILTAAQTTTSTTAGGASSSVISEILPPVTTVEPTLRPGTLSPVAQTRIKNLTANLSNRMDGTVRRIDNVTLRLEARLLKLEAEGTDVTTAANQVAQAKISLEIAKKNLSGIDASVAAFLGSANPQENWLELKRIYGETRDALLSAYDHIRQALSSVATTVADPTSVTETASTTSSTSISTL